MDISAFTKATISGSETNPKPSKTRIKKDFGRQNRIDSIKAQKDLFLLMPAEQWSTGRASGSVEKMSDL
jgi:hypothetical protein